MVEAAELAAMHRLPLADSIIYATAVQFEAILWTQDSDFEDLEGVGYRPRRNAL
jgi:toxin FitB